jgi:phosphoribosyl 1,2-cyclic phosphate phosphodiesterase
LTNLHVDMDYAEVDRLTPPHVHPCRDGLVIDLDDK